MRQDTRRFISQETGNLYIAKVEPSDVGNYTCVVTNTVTKTRVQGPPTPLVLRSDGELTLTPSDSVRRPLTTANKNLCQCRSLIRNEIDSMTHW